jgi:hypothetical protein
MDTPGGKVKEKAFMPGFGAIMTKENPTHKPVEPRSLVDYVEPGLWAHDLHGTLDRALEVKALFEHIIVRGIHKGDRYLLSHTRQELVEALLKALPDETRIVDIATESHLLVWDTGVVWVWVSEGGRDAALKISTTDQPEVMSGAIEVFVGMTQQFPSQGTVSVLMRNSPNSPLRMRSLGKGGEPLVVENYNPEIVEGFHAICADLKRPKPHGRISILEGPPGTGKTYLVRAIMSEVPAKYVLIQPKLMSELSDPEVLVTMVQDEYEMEPYGTSAPKLPTVLVCEDADTMLASRDAQTGSLISAINALAIGDGILGELMDLRLLATTNVKIEKIDPAILRPGRLSQWGSVRGAGRQGLEKAGWRRNTTCRSL